MKQTIRRMIAGVLGASLLAPLSCSKNDSEILSREPEIAQVVIGVTGVGADVETRTALGEGDGKNVPVHWVEGDQIRLWAFQSGTSTVVLDKAEFTFNYFSPTYSRAAFAADVDISGFDSGQTYDYVALYPSQEPGADGKIHYTIDATQNGAFESQYNIMAGTLKAASGLKTVQNTADEIITLHFDQQLVHLLKFDIDEELFAHDDQLISLNLTFPRPILGEVVVDVSGGEPQIAYLPDEENRTIQINFENRDPDEPIYFAILPTKFEPEDEIIIRCQGATGESWLTYSFPAAKAFEAGHLTPITLHVPALQWAYTVVKFKVTDDLLNDANNKYGENTLGERVYEVRLTGEAGSFSGATLGNNMRVELSEDGEKEILICTVPEVGKLDDSTPFDGVYTLRYLLREGDVAAHPLQGKELEVAYESERALIQTDAYDEVKSEAITLVWKNNDPNPVNLVVPYLFEEDFSGVSGFNSNDENGNDVSGDKSAYYLEKSNLSGWTGARIGAKTGTAIRLAGYCRDVTIIVNILNEQWYARVDSAPLSHIKPNVQAAVSLQFRYGTNGDKTFSGASIGQTIYVGSVDPVDSDNEIIGYSSESRIGTFVDEFHFDEGTDTYDQISNMYVLPQSKRITCNKRSRIAIQTYPDKSDRNSNHTCWLYLDDFKVQLVPKE